MSGSCSYRPGVTGNILGVLKAPGAIPGYAYESLPGVAITNERKAALILGEIIVSEGSWVGVNVALNGAGRFLHYCGVGVKANPVAWVAALAVAALYVAYSSRIPSVRDSLLRLDGLKVLAIGVGIFAGCCEEAVFRKALMEHGSHVGWSVVVQVAASALAFGAVHAIWGVLRLNWRAAAGAMAATGSLGLLLAMVYLLGGRNVAPCILSHALINFFAEPGLILSALRGEMGKTFPGNR